MFDEMDKQYETIKTRSRLNISNGGILSAIAGVQSLAHNVIIIMTANHLNKFDEEFKKLLLRKGRIDEIFEFNQPVEKFICN